MNIKSAKWAIKELEQTQLKRIAWSMKRDINEVRRDRVIYVFFYLCGLVPLIIEPSLYRLVFAIIMLAMPLPMMLSTRKRYERTALGIYNDWLRQASEIEQQDIRKFIEYFTETTGMVK